LFCAMHNKFNGPEQYKYVSVKGFRFRI